MGCAFSIHYYYISPSPKCLWFQHIKNKINQILENDNVTISHDFPSPHNMSGNHYNKCWIITIFVDICGFSSFCLENSANELYVGQTLRTFHEGILEIFKNYNIKNIDIQGDGIFGVIKPTHKNDDQSKKALDCSIELNGFLGSFWKKLDYKIAVSVHYELIIIVGKGKNKKLVFCGGSVNKAKKIIEDSKLKNCILLDPLFIKNNEEIFLDNKSKYYETDGNNNFWSTYIFKEWKE